MAEFTDLPAILSKGQDLKKSEIKLLLEEGVPRKAIAVALDYSMTEFSELCRNWDFKATMTFEEYKADYQNYSNDNDLAAAYGLTANQVQAYKKKWRADGHEVPNRTVRKGLSQNDYLKLKKKGMKDKEIIKALDISHTTLTKYKKKWGLIK